MLVNTVIAVLWMATALVWVVAFGLIMALEYPNDPHKVRAALLALIPATLPASTAIWVMNF